MGSLSGTLYIGVTGNLRADVLLSVGFITGKASQPATARNDWFIGSLMMTCTRRLGGRSSWRGGAGRRKLRWLSRWIRIGWTWLRSGIKTVMQVGMLRLRETCSQGERSLYAQHDKGGCRTHPL